MHRPACGAPPCLARGAPAATWPPARSRGGSRRTWHPLRRPCRRAWPPGPVRVLAPPREIPAAPGLAPAFVPLDQRVGAMVVDRLEILRLHHVGFDALVEIEDRRHIAYQVLDELRIVVRSEERRVGKECRARWATDH